MKTSRRKILSGIAASLSSFFVLPRMLIGKENNKELMAFPFIVGNEKIYPLRFKQTKNGLVIEEYKAETTYSKRITYYKNDKIHRDNDLPAVEYASGEKHWYKNGQKHRDNDLPAVEYAERTKCWKWWYKDGQRHRDNDLPAAEFPDGTKEWYRNGQLHREGDKPAIIECAGRKFWYKNGKLIKDNL